MFWTLKQNIANSCLLANILMIMRQFKFRFYDFASVLGRRNIQDVTGQVRARKWEQAIPAILEAAGDSLADEHRSLIVFKPPLLPSRKLRGLHFSKTMDGSNAVLWVLSDTDPEIAGVAYRQTS